MGGAREFFSARSNTYRACVMIRTLTSIPVDVIPFHMLLLCVHMHMQLDWLAASCFSEDGAVAVAVWSVSEALVRCWSHRPALHAGAGL